MGTGIWGQKYRCEECRNNPSLRAAWGCEDKAKVQEPTFAEMENGKMYHYWCCPVKLIPRSVRGFLMLYRYCKDFSGVTMPPVGGVSARFLMAAQYYDSKVVENMKLKAENR